MYPPEIIDNFFEDIALILKKLRIEETAAFKGVFTQHSPAETVNGKDGRLVE